jgi:hypothetical protein
VIRSTAAPEFRRTGAAAAATLKIVPDFKLPLYGADTERGDLAP